MSCRTSGCGFQKLMFGSFQISQMMRRPDELLESADLLIVVDPDFDWDWARPRLRETQTIVDVQGTGKTLMKDDPRYVGLCW